MGVTYKQVIIKESIYAPTGTFNKTYSFEVPAADKQTIDIYLNASTGDLISAETYLDNTLLPGGIFYGKYASTHNAITPGSHKLTITATAPILQTPRGTVSPTFGIEVALYLYYEYPPTTPPPLPTPTPTPTPTPEIPYYTLLPIIFGALLTMMTKKLKD
jgi:hypothetical protein